MNARVWLNLEAGAGTTVHDAIREGIRVAGILRCGVELLVGTIVIPLEHDSDLIDMAKAWEEALAEGLLVALPPDVRHLR